ncbi:MAG: aminopeptidase [Deltaproteobacteria bacterium]|nr:aminopeptidase [Deltaproteobacteria bacterium]
MRELELMNSADRLVREVIGVTSNDRVLVIADADSFVVGKVFSLSCRALGAETVISMVPMTGEHGSEPPSTIAAAMKAADVVFGTTTHAITHTQARLDAFAAGARFISLRGVTEDMMIKGAMTVDFQELRERTEQVAQKLTSAHEVSVTSAFGTDVTFSISGRTAFVLDGYFHEDYGFATLPPGEAPTCPVEGTTEGVIAFDYSMDGIGRLSQPLKLTVKKGSVTSVSGGTEEVRFLEDLFERIPFARNIAEFAIGTNPRARLIGNLGEDKKLYGTVHFAIGDNKSLGGKVESNIHLDGLILKPSVYLDKKLLVDEGKILL